MTKTYRKDHKDKLKRDNQTIQKSIKDMKRSTKKLRKYKIIDKWDIPNHDKYGRIVP